MRHPLRFHSLAIAAAVVLVVSLGAGIAPAAEVTLQQGADGYTGCSAATVWEPKTKQAEVPGALCLRGCVAYSEKVTEQVDEIDKATKKPTGNKVPAERTRQWDQSNHVLVRFDLQTKYKYKGKVARARLMVFVPEVRKQTMIGEVVCREVKEFWTDKADWEQTGAGRKWSTPGVTMDEATDYANGRPAGAIDSFSFWEYTGQYFPHKYTFMQVPAGGKWVELNVTPLVEKWLADPASNHGVALHPITQADRRFPNRMEIDIPGPSAADAAKRPKLVLDVAPLAEPLAIGMTHGLRKYCDKSPRYTYTGPWTDSYEMEMARNEYEPFQVIVKPLAGDLKGVTFETGDLAGPAGAKIPAADVTWNPQEMVLMNRNGKTRDWYFHGKEFWIPDPLTNARPTDCRRHVGTPFWFTVRTRPQTKAGTYKGTITIKAAGVKDRAVNLTVKVWDYQVPERWNFQTMGQSCWDNYWRAMQPHLDKVTAEKGREAAQKERAVLHRKYIDFLMDHRFMPTEQYGSGLSPALADLPYCVAERGGNTIYLNGSYKQSDAALKELRKRLDDVAALDKKLREDGKYTHPETLVDMSLVYIGDETNKWDEMRANSNAIRRLCPELMIMIGGSFPRKELDGIIDIYDPQIGGSSGTFSLTEEMTGKIAESQAKGERFFWYDAAGPMLPYPNVQCEEPLIAARSVFWMTWKYGVTGFEYYCYAIWSHNMPQKDKVTGKWVQWPEKPFTPWGWGDTNGDGMLYYPGPDGPFSSVRFENIRDGIEDWESLYVLRDAKEALEKKGADAAGKALIAKAETLLKVPDAVVKDLQTWSWEPEVLLGARREVGETLDAMSKLVTEDEIMAVRLARKQAELKRQRDMLAKRAAEAGKAK